MVEAAMVLPIVILIIVSLLLIMLHDYDVHRGQLEIHKTMIASWNSPPAAFSIQKKTLETSSKISGMVNQFFHTNKEYRCYRISPAECIRLGEMITFNDKE